MPFSNSHLRKFNNTVRLTKKWQHKAQINGNVTSSILRTLQLVNYENSFLKGHIVTHKEKSRTICSTCSECEVAYDSFIASIMDCPTLVGNTLVTDKSNFGNVENLLLRILRIMLNFQLLNICIDIVLDIAASCNSSDTIWFTIIEEPCIADAGQSYIIEYFLEKSRSNSKGHYFKVDIKNSYFSHESIV